MRALISADKVNAEAERESDGPGDLFGPAAEHAAKSGLTVQQIVAEMRKEPGYVRIAQQMVFADYTEDAKRPSSTSRLAGNDG